MHYNPNQLNYNPIFSKDELDTLENINQSLSLQSFLKNKNLIEKVESILDYYEKADFEKSKEFFIRR